MTDLAEDANGPRNHDATGLDGDATTAAGTDSIEPVSDSAFANDAADSSTRRRRRPDRGLLIASFTIACGVVLIVWGMFSAVTGNDGIDRPEAIESLSPVENAVQVLQQERIAVDLEFGYEARLILDGIVLETTNIGEIEAEPGQLLALPPTAIFDPGNSIISFQPTEGAIITEFSQGRHQVRIEYWLITEGPEQASSYNWSFTVV